MTDKVSIVVPIFNSEKYLAACLESILKQSYSNIEIILINDGSTDKSPSIIHQYAKKDSRIITATQANSGQSSARNHGLDLITGNYICFIDSDDTVMPNYIAKLISSYQTNPHAILSVCGFKRKIPGQNSFQDLYTTPAKTRKPHESQKDYILRLLIADGRLYSSNNKLFKAETAKKIKFNENINFAEDTQFVLDYLNKTHGEINFVTEPLYIYNFGSTGSTINRSATDWHNWQISFQYLKSWVGDHPTTKQYLLLILILLRWRISYHRSKVRAQKSDH